MIAFAAAFVIFLAQPQEPALTTEMYLRGRAEMVDLSTPDKRRLDPTADPARIEAALQPLSLLTARVSDGRGLPGEVDESAIADYLREVIDSAWVDRTAMSGCLDAVAELSNSRVRGDLAFAAYIREPRWLIAPSIKLSECLDSSYAVSMLEFLNGAVQRSGTDGVWSSDLFFVATIADQSRLNEFSDLGEIIEQRADTSKPRDRDLLAEYDRARSLFVARSSPRALADWAVDHSTRLNGLVDDQSLWALEQIRKQSRDVAGETIQRLRDVASSRVPAGGSESVRHAAMTLRLSNLRDWGVENGLISEGTWPDVGSVAPIEN